jgi:hypothetical protein
LTYTPASKVSEAINVKDSGYKKLKIQVLPSKPVAMFNCNKLENQICGWNWRGTEMKQGEFYKNNETGKVGKIVETSPLAIFLKIGGKFVEFERDIFLDYWSRVRGESEYKLELTLLYDEICQISDKHNVDTKKLIADLNSLSKKQSNS